MAGSLDPGTSPPSTGATPPPSADSRPVASFPPRELAWAQELEIAVDRLAVRTSPSTSSPLVTGVRWDPDRSRWSPTSEQVRLSSGDVVRVSLGPIVHDGYTWYQVWPISDAPPEDEVRWNADGDEVYADEGWIATSDEFVRARPPRQESDFPPKVFAGGGSGLFVSEAFPADFLAGRWALSPEQSPCDLTLTIEGTDVVLASESRIGSFRAGWLSNDADLGGGMHRLVVESGVAGDPEAHCSWAVRVGQSQ